MRSLWIGLCVFLAAPAQASPFELYGFDARALGTADAASPVATDPSSVYNNPAGLVQSKTFRFLISGHGSVYRASVVSQDDTKPLDCAFCHPPSSGGVTLGLQFPLGGKLHDVVSLGLGLY